MIAKIYRQKRLFKTVSYDGRFSRSVRRVKPDQNAVLPVAICANRLDLYRPLADNMSVFVRDEHDVAEELLLYLEIGVAR